MNFSNSAICYEATQRIYRNAVVRHIRSVFSKKFPDNWRKQLKHTIGDDEWNRNDANVKERLVSGELKVKVADDFDLLDLAHFYNLFDKHFEILFPRRADEPPKEVSRRKRSILDWSQTVKTFRDPMSHPPEQDFTFQDVFRMVDCACRVLEALALPESVQLQNIIDDLAAGQPKEVTDPPEPLQHSLPARESVVVDFIGRSDELRRLWDWLKDPYSRRWAIAGEGGKGKSAIAYEFAAAVRFAAPEYIEAVWWLSAKKRKFTERRAVQTSSPDFADLPSACNKLLVDYGRDVLETKLEDRKNALVKLLNEMPALVIVDDLDSLEGGDEAAIEFFTLIAPATRSKILLTTRRTVFGMAHTTTHVSGMKPEDFERFVRSRCHMFGLDTKILTPQRIKDLAAMTESSPLYAEDLLRLAASVSLHEAMKGWKDKDGDEARKYALKRELDILSTEAKQALLCACLSAGPVSFSELEALTALGKGKLRTAISEMQRLFLVPKPRLIEGEERFDVNVNTRALIVRVLEGTESYRRAKNAVDAVAQRLPYLDRGRTGAVIRQAVFLAKANEFSKAEETIRSVLNSEPNNPDLIGALGYIYKCWRPKRFTDARQQFERAVQLKCRRVDPYRHWIQLEMGEKEWTNAFRVAEQGVKYIPDCAELLYWAGYAHSKLGRELSSGLVLEKARTELEAAKDFLQRALRPPEHLRAAACPWDRASAIRSQAVWG
jgi:tetratricopeptide (TPR) repeat protein